MITFLSRAGSGFGCGCDRAPGVVVIVFRVWSGSGGCGRVTEVVAGLRRLWSGYGFGSGFGSGDTSGDFGVFADRGPPLSLKITAFPAHLGHISGKKRPRCQQYQGSRSTFLTALPTYNRTSGTKFPPTVLQIRKKTLPLHPLLSLVMSLIPRDKQKNITDRFGSSAG